MKIDTMKLIDHRVGVVICVFLDAIHRVARLFRGRPKEIGEAKQILVTKYFGMGSTLLATPMMQALRERFPEANITLFTFESNAAFGRLLTCVDDVVPLRTRHFGVFLKDLASALWQFRRRHFDVAIDLEFFSKFSTIVTYLSGARLRVGFQLRSIWRGDLLTHPVYMNQHRHITRAYLAMAQAIGAPVADPRGMRLAPPPDAVRISPDAEARVDARVDLDGSGPVVALNPNASELSLERRWPAERFVELVRRLRDAAPNARVYMIGGPDDRSYVESMVAQCGDRVGNLAGELGIEELFPFLRRCDLFITNDSGPLHMACLMETPTVSFFGPETPAFYGPVGEDGRTKVFYKCLYCSPCLSAYNVKTSECQGDNRCLQAITVDEVFDASITMLNRRGEANHAAGE